LPPHVRSGLVDAVGRLRGIDGTTEVRLTGRDIVRHRLVQEIVRAYDDEPKRKR
jgi:phosphate starvation-inducible protein PhoH and related proteins